MMVLIYLFSYSGGILRFKLEPITDEDGSTGTFTGLEFSEWGSRTLSAVGYGAG